MVSLAGDFHFECDNKGAIMILVMTTTGHIFGGSVQKPWTSAGGCVADPKAFLFSWNYKEIYSQYQKFENTLQHVSSYGPTFGACSADLYITSICNSNQ
jgi:hypothetical protein